MSEKALINALKTAQETSKVLSRRAFEIDNQIAELLIEQQQTINQLTKIIFENQKSEREFRIKTTERIYLLERKIAG